MFTLNIPGCCVLLCWLTVSPPVRAQHTVTYVEVNMADRAPLSSLSVAGQDGADINVSGLGSARLSDPRPEPGLAIDGINGVSPAPGRTAAADHMQWYDGGAATVVNLVGGYYESGTISTAADPFQSALCGTICLFNIDYFVGNAGALAINAGPAR